MISFEELTEFEDGKPQPKKDPIFAMWMNMIRRDDGVRFNPTDSKVDEFTDLFLQKRQTKEGIQKVKKIIQEKLKWKN